MDAFQKLLVSRFEKLKLGDPADIATDLGPQADAAQANTVAKYLEVGKEEGHVLTGGSRSGAGENFIQPTIFTNVSDTARLNVEEIFGPVLVFHEFETEAEVIARANDTDCEYTLEALGVSH